ncbi:MAG: caspase family protein, partial [Actinobacteria bacterium]|nr:caspase family protein [Actinomycetota bacterium]
AATTDGGPVRSDRPTLRGRYAAIDARLDVPAAVRTIAILAVGLLAVQTGVVLDRSAAASVDAVAAAASAHGDGALVSAADGNDPVGAPGTSGALAAPAGTADETAARVDGDAAPAAGSAAAAQGGTTGSASSTSAARAPSTPAQDRFESRFPDHARAGQSTAKPATTRWAVLIGVNEHSGRTRDNVGSRQDAEELAEHLRSLGWAPDHVLLLTDGNATRENIVESFRWLQRKADEESVVVVHYSGHVKQWHGYDYDGDREVTDEALWPSDNRFVTDREVGDLLGKVRAGRLWFNVGGCEAAGFDDWGITGPDRIATYSSAEHQKSYEDPRRGNSIWGWYLVDQGLRAGLADADGDGNVTVEEAFRYATPRADQRTRGQSHGRQTPEVNDRLRGEFDLRIPRPPRQRSESRPSSDDSGWCLLCPGTTATALPRWR